MSLVSLFPDYPSIPHTPADHVAWHLRIAKGIPLSLYRDLCGPGLLNAAKLAKVVFGERPVPRKEFLELEAANTVYRVLVSLELARAAFGGDTAKAVKWLSEPHGGLKGREPLSLLGNSMGFDYVRTAIARLTES